MGEEFKLFVGGLAWSIDDDKLWETFKEFGEIPFCRVVTDRETQQSRGFGFVSFAKEEDAKKAEAEMNGKTIEGRWLKVNFAAPKGEAPATPSGEGGKGKGKGGKGGGKGARTDEFKLFVGGLSWGTDDDALWKAFEVHGEIAFGRVMTDRETGDSRGFGFVSYKTKEDAEKAVAAMDQAEVDGRTINVNFAKPKEAAPAWGADAAEAPAAETPAAKTTFDEPAEEAAAEPAAEEKKAKKEKKEKKDKKRKAEEAPEAPAAEEKKAKKEKKEKKEKKAKKEKK